MTQAVFTANLKKYRLEKGLTQEQVADTFHVNAQTVSRWECGTTLPDVLTLPLLAQLYEVTVDDFYKSGSIAYDNYAQRLAAVYEATRAPEDFIRCLAEYDKLQKTTVLSLADKWNLATLHQKERASDALSFFSINPLRLRFQKPSGRDCGGR